MLPEPPDNFSVQICVVRGHNPWSFPCSNSPEATAAILSGRSRNLARPGLLHISWAQAIHQRSLPMPTCPSLVALPFPNCAIFWPPSMYYLRDQNGASPQGPKDFVCCQKPLTNRARKFLGTMWVCVFLRSHLSGQLAVHLTLEGGLLLWSSSAHHLHHAKFELS